MELAIINSARNSVIRTYDNSAKFVANRYKEINDARIKSRFERQIQDLIKLANAHKAKGVKLGDKVYVEIYSHCLALVDSYCLHSSRTRESILSSAPALRELQTWAEYDPQAEQARKAKVILLAAVGVPVVVGILVAVGHTAYFYVYHLLTFWIK